MPLDDAKISYCRLHGLEARHYKYHYNNDELEGLRKIIRREPKEIRVMFNNILMFQGATVFDALNY